MSSNATVTPQPRTNKRPRITPASAGLPDPRPVTEYDCVYEEIAGHSRITVTLRQPCVIRQPLWSFVDVSSGEHMVAASATATDNTTIVFDFADVIPGTVCFLDVPYQDMQVQNFQGGFVRPGGTWFREPK